jgi:PAS domain S-box-containing protein
LPSGSGAAGNRAKSVRPASRVFRTFAKHPPFLVSALLVGLVTALNSAMDRLLVQEKTIRAEVEQRRHTELAALRLAAIVESSDDAIVTKDLNGIITSWNKGAERLFGYVADEAIGKPVSILIPPDRPSEEPDILERLRRGERIDHYETMRRCKDGSLIDISLTVSPLVNAEGKIIGASKIARDITERKRASEAQEMLTREMSHRVKNAFAVVNGIVGLSALSSSTPDAMARQIRECLTALSRAHDLTRPGLLEPVSMSRQSTTFKALVRTIFAPYLDAGKSTGRDRLIIKGPDVPIAEKSLTGLALLLHELATNAVKYGSLSSPKGCVGIKTSTANGEFLMTWKEEDGPRLGGPPNEEGFGSLLVRRIVTGQFGGRLSYDWRPEGLVVCLSGPMERLASVEGETSGAHSALSTIVRN